MKKTILITGGLGYTGSHIATMFPANEYQLILIDNLKNSSLTTLADLEDIIGGSLNYYEVDIKHLPALDKVIAKTQPDLVIHTAHTRPFGEQQEDAFLYYQNNVIGTINLMDAMYKNGINNLIHLSTNLFYDHTFTAPPFSENDICKPYNAFSTTKYMTEQMIENICNIHHFHAITLRISYTLGAHRSGLLGRKLTLLQGGDIANYLYNVALGRFPKISIYGKDYNTADGTISQDFIHILDLAEAAKKAADRLLRIVAQSQSDNYIYETYNIGSEMPITRLELLSQAEDVIDTTIPYEIKPHRLPHEKSNIISITKAKKYLHRSPQRTIYEALEDGWKYIKKGG